MNRAGLWSCVVAGMVALSACSDPEKPGPESCEDSCPGTEAAECAGGRLRRCVESAEGCFAWTEPSRCPSGFCADESSCGRCSNECSVAGATACADGALKACFADANGCLAWSVATPCPGGFCGDATSCGACDHVCATVGETRCLVGELRTCVADANGCRAWSEPTRCPDGFCQDTKSCGACHDTCAQGATECEDGQLRTCEADEHGCLAWRAPAACEDGFCADAATCGVCDDTCPSAGATACADGAIELCVADAKGCLSWGPKTACAEGFCGDTTSCGNCSHECALSATRCTNGQLESCAADLNGCRSWSEPAACTDGFCADATSCGVCANECPSTGGTACAEGALKTCGADLNGCLAWSEPVACEDGFCANATSCGGCADECPSADATACAEGALKTCVANLNGCLAWSEPVACEDGFCASAASCGVCEHECPTASATACAEGALKTCGADANGCLVWSEPVACEDGFCADAASCGSCDDECAAGATECANGQTRTCVADERGCLAWSDLTPCPYGNGCHDALSCDPCQHECTAWGARCAGDTLETCVVDLQGCRRLLSEPCRLGCADAACATCPSIPEAMTSAAMNDQSGFYKDLVLQGSTAIARWEERNGPYTGSARGLTTVDISDPSALVATSVQTLATSGRMTSLQLVGDRLYFLNGDGIEIYDAADPLSPQRLGSFPFSDSVSVKRDLSVTGTLACMAADDGVRFVDISQSASPVLLSQYHPAIRPAQIQCAGRYAAVSGGTGIEIVDLLDPASPVFASGATVSNLAPYGDTLLFDGSTLFASSYSSYNSTLWDSLDVYRFTPPDRLEKVGALGGISGLNVVVRRGDELAAATGTSVGLIDISNLAAPRWKKRWAVEDLVRGLAYDGATLFASGDGVAAFDPSRMPDVLLRSIASNDYLNGSATLGSLVFQARSATGLVILDYRDPADPVLLSTAPMRATDVKLAGHLAFVTVESGSTAKLQVYDVSCPWSPELIGSANVPGGTYDQPLIRSLSLSGGRAWALCSVGYVCVFDVENPAAPTLLAKSDVISATVGSSSASSVFEVQGNNLILPEPDLLTVVDMSDPSAPATVGTVALPGYLGPVDIEVGGGKAYVVMPCFYVQGDLCHYVVDLSQPSQPRVVGSHVQWLFQSAGLYSSLNSYGKFSSLRLEGTRLFLSNRWGGIYVLDVSDPAQPRREAEYWTAFPARKLFVKDRFLTSFVVSDFPYPAPARHADQVIEMCQ